MSVAARILSLFIAPSSFCFFLYFVQEGLWFFAALIMALFLFAASVAIESWNA